MFQYIGFAIKYLPIVIAAVQMVEGIVSKDTSGDDKKELATKFVIDTVSKFGVKMTPSLRDVIGQVIDLAVTILNFFGIFVHKDTIEDVEDIRVVETEEAEGLAKTATSENEARMKELEKALKR